MQTTNDGHGPGQNTPVENDEGFVTGQGNKPQKTTNYAPDFKPKPIPVATLILCMERAGHRVVKGDRGDFTCCKFGLTRYCQDHQALAAFARQVGAV